MKTHGRDKVSKASGVWARESFSIDNCTVIHGESFHMVEPNISKRQVVSDMPGQAIFQTPFNAPLPAGSLPTPDRSACRYGRQTPQNVCLILQFLPGCLGCGVKAPKIETWHFHCLAELLVQDPFLFPGCLKFIEDPLFHDLLFTIILTSNL